MSSAVQLEFPFPFEPYDIQKQFMSNLYECFENEKLGIFESPTGTGKSLSLICGSLKWLNDYETRRKAELSSQIAEQEAKKAKADANTDDDWVETAYEVSKIDDKICALKKSLKAREVLDKRVEELKTRRSILQAGTVRKINRDFANLCAGLKTGEKSLFQPGDENAIEEDDLESDDHAKAPNEGDELDDEEKENEPPAYKETQIIFASRTHSQLAQFLGEVDKSPYGEEVRAVTLASRANLCINERVTRLGNPSFINERCLELKEKSSKTTKKSEDGNAEKKQRKTRRIGDSEETSCPYYRSEGISNLAERALASVLDVEDLKTAGLELKACPYYAARKAAKEAQLVALPYNILLHKKTREATGIDLKDSVVVVDEAHNLADTIASVHGARLTGAQLCHAYSQLTQYHDKYKTKFAPKNKLKIGHVIFVLKKLIMTLGGRPGLSTPEDKNPSVTEENEVKIFGGENFIFESNFDPLNLHDLVEFCRAMRLPQKLYGFQAVYGKKEEPKPAASKLKHFLQNYKKEQPKDEPKPEAIKEKPKAVRSSPLLSVLEFLNALTSGDTGGKVIVKKVASLGESSIQYLILDPSEHFRPVVSDARSVVVAGGTMKPLDEFKDDLFSGNAHRIHEFSCGHVVPKENVLCLGFAKGSSGKVLDFTFGRRSESVKELGATLGAVMNVCPGGFVVFFPSYGFEAEVHSVLEKSGVLEKLDAKKNIFREPKNSADVDSVLESYASAVKTSGGATLFAVVGGKMSEGINFGDDLGRVVVVVGLPYPNLKSPELKEKMDYLDKKREPGAGKRYYESLCLKALNQSIGRVIRHKGDYAAILLFDARYCNRGDIKEGLPGWMKGSFSAHGEFRTGFTALRNFFNAKK